MSVAARVAREMGVKLGNEVRSVGARGPPRVWDSATLPSGPHTTGRALAPRPQPCTLREHQPTVRH